MNERMALELRRVIKSAGACRKPEPERRFHKDDAYLSYGVKTPDFWKIMKEFRPRFLGLPLEERLELAGRLLGERVGELGHAGIHLLALSVADLQPRQLPALDLLMEDFLDWSHVDHFCGEVIQPLLWRHRQAVLALLRDWNRSPNRWKRRASVVAFTRKVGESGEFTGPALRFCRNLVFDDEDIVRKGVGWALKDNLRSAQSRVLGFIRRIRREGASATIILYAIRDLDEETRRAVLAVRKAPARRGLRKPGKSPR